MSEGTAREEKLTTQITELESGLKAQEEEKSALSGELKDLKLQIAGMWPYYDKIYILIFSSCT